MAFNFPSSPTSGQEYVSGGVTFVWNGFGWTLKGNTAAVQKTGDTMTGKLTIDFPGATAALEAVSNGKMSFAVAGWGCELYTTDEPAANGPYFYLGRSRGADWDHPTGVQQGDVLGAIVLDSMGPGVADYGSGGSIYAIVDAPVAVGSIPTAWVFKTGNSGEGVERLRIASNGQVLLSADPTVALGVATKQYVDSHGGLPLTGGTLTGDLWISKATPGLTLNKPTSGTSAYINGAMNNIPRWGLVLGNNTAESGSNAGSDFLIARYSDAGVYIDTPLQINRKDGITALLSGTGTQLRLRNNTYSVLFRNDDANFYFLQTASGDPDGTWNTLRPFRIGLADGAITFAHQVNAQAAVTISGAMSAGSMSTGGALSVSGTATLNAVSWNQAAGSIYQNGPGNLLINANGSAGYDAFISYHRPGGGYAVNMGLMNDNRFGFGGWSVGSGVQYRFWSREDFNEIPVNNTRLVYVGDYVHSSDYGLEEPYGASACHTGCSGAAPSGFGGSYLTMRYRQLQVRRADGYYNSESG